MEGKNTYCNKMTFYIVTEGKRGKKAQPSELWFHCMIKTGGDVIRPVGLGIQPDYLFGTNWNVSVARSIENKSSTESWTQMPYQSCTFVYLFFDEIT